MPRSHAEAQAQRFAEIDEIDAEMIHDAYFSLARLVSKPGGEQFLELFEQVQEVRDGLLRRLQVAEAAAAAAKGRRRR